MNRHFCYDTKLCVCVSSESVLLILTSVFPHYNTKADYTVTDEHEESHCIYMQIQRMIDTLHNGVGVCVCLFLSRFDVISFSLFPE